MSIRWVTADTHFGHTNIIKHAQGKGHRPPIGTPVSQMDEQIIGIWNKHIGVNDIVYHLGDFAWHKSVADSVFPRLNGKIHLLRGNHDYPSTHLPFESIKDVDNLTVKLEPNAMLMRKQKVKVWMSHYAHRSWPTRHVHLFGHSHGNLPDNGSASIDVGWDGPMGGKPIKLDVVVAKLSSRLTSYTPEDHH